MVRIFEKIMLFGYKDKDNNLLGLSASLLAGERASKDTSPLGPDEVAADPSMI